MNRTSPVVGAQGARPVRLLGAVIELVGSRFSSSVSLSLVFLIGESGMTGMTEAVF